MESKLSTEQIKEICKEMLSFIKSVCEQNSINYYLAYGTLLGARRHSGFIPWDDDVDIYMFREDYNKFVSIMSESESTRYALKSIETDSKYTLPLPKLIDLSTTLIQTNQVQKFELGVYVDIFILDTISCSPNIVEKDFKKLVLIQKMWEHAQYKKGAWGLGIKGTIHNCLHYVASIFGARYFAKKLHSEASKYSAQESMEVCSSVYSAYGRHKDTFHRSVFGNGGSLLFENEEYNVPIQYDMYLSQMYGDYMTLPPVEKRVSHHNFVSYYK